MLAPSMPPKRNHATPATSSPAKCPRLLTAPAAPSSACDPNHEDLALAPHAASGVPTSFAALPLDIVQHVLGFIPLRPRLLVTALTCRRWSEAARRATTALPGHLALAAYSAACKRLPIVTSLSITLPPGDVALPEAITSLSTLTSLTVRMYLNSSPDWLAGLLENNCASLTSFSAHLKHQTTPFVAEHLLRARLPSLRTLSMQWSRWKRVPLASVAPVTALVTAYASQLRSLSLDCFEPALFLASPTSFPRLTHFVANTLEAGGVDAILKAAPQLVALGTAVLGDHTPPAWFPLLSHLFASKKHTIRSWLFEQANAIPTLTSMSLHSLYAVTRHGLPLAYLSAVEVEFFTSTHSFMLFTTFPNLTSLALCNTSTSLAHLNTLLEGFLAGSAPLRRLSLTMSTDVGKYNEFRNLLPQAEKRGLECLHLRLPRGEGRETLRAIAQTFRWLDVITEAIP